MDLPFASRLKSFSQKRPGVRHRDARRVARRVARQWWAVATRGGSGSWSRTVGCGISHERAKRTRMLSPSPTGERARG